MGVNELRNLSVARRRFRMSNDCIVLNIGRRRQVVKFRKSFFCRFIANGQTVIGAQFVTLGAPGTAAGGCGGVPKMNEILDFQF